MLSTTETRIYLANQRGCSETAWFRSYYTFNFAEFRSESRTPFGPLLAVNEHTLKEGGALSFVLEEPVQVLLIPIVGLLRYRYGNVEGKVDVGLACYILLPPGIPLEVTNTYTSNSIHFLHVCVRADKNFRESYPGTCMLDFDDNRSELTALDLSSDGLFFIRNLSGREDIISRSKFQHGGIFVYQISGTCEVHGRLLLPGDALSLMNVETIEFEALTHEAILFVAHLPFRDGS